MSDSDKNENKACVKAQEVENKNADSNIISPHSEKGKVGGGSICHLVVDILIRNSLLPNYFAFCSLLLRS